VTTRHYDVVVIGGRLSATICAALLAKRGLRGLIIDQGELASIDGRLLPDLILSDQGSLAMELVHMELGVKEDLKVRSQPISPIVQAIFPDQRIDLYTERGAMYSELRRGFGTEDAERFAKALRMLDEAEKNAGVYLSTAGELPPSGFFGKRQTAQAARNHPELLKTVDASGILEGLPEELQEILIAPVSFLTHIDARRPNEIPIGRFARPVARFLRGAFHLDDGRSLRELFLEIAKRKGFEVKTTGVESIDPKGKTIAIRVAGNRDVLITSDVLVDCSADLSGLDTIPMKTQSKELALMLQAAKPRGFLHALSIEIDRAVIPPGMGEYVILLNGRKDPTRFDQNDPDAEDRPVLLTSRISQSSPSRLQIIGVHPVSASRAHSGRMEQLDLIMRRRIERLIPFFAEGAPAIAPLSTSAATRENRPFLAHPHLLPDLDPLAGITGVSMRTTYKNIFVAGPAVMPGLGIEGEYLSALQAADACELLGTGVKRPKTLAARTPATLAAAEPAMSAPKAR
jgi:phytoene dehydrogenase-like protein